MKTKTVEVQGFIIEVTEATMRHGIERGLLITEGRQAIQDALEKDPENPMPRALQVLRLYLYPDLMAVTDQFLWPDLPDQGLPIFEDFAELPDGLCNPWAAAVYELNPHWEIKDPDQVARDAEKKATNSEES